MMRSVTNIIQPLGLLLPAAFTLSVIWGFFGGVEWLLRDQRILREASCAFSSFEMRSGDLYLQIDCGEMGTARISRDRDIYQYLTNPGPFHCTLFMSGTMNCRYRQAVSNN